MIRAVLRAEDRCCPRGGDILSLLCMDKGDNAVCIETILFTRTCGQAFWAQPTQTNKQTNKPIAIWVQGEAFGIPGMLSPYKLALILDLVMDSEYAGKEFLREPLAKAFHTPRRLLMVTAGPLATRALLVLPNDGFFMDGFSANTERGLGDVITNDFSPDDFFPDGFLAFIILEMALT